MKNILILGIVVLVSNSAFSDEAVKEVILTQGKWQAAKITDSAIFRKNACVAQTQTATKDATLQVYAEEVSPGNYTELTVQVIARKPLGTFYRAIMVDDGERAKYHLPLASKVDQATGTRAVMTRLKDRRGAIEMIKKADTIDVNFYDEKAKMIKNVEFSLSGSSKTVDAVIQNCKAAVPEGESKF